MPTTFTSATLSGTYNDDFDKDKHFHQILFNSGRALQARELTQLQTLIYQELGRFGRNIFKEGAAVSSGGMAINSSVEYIKVSSTNAGGAFADIPVGTVFQDQDTGLEARVLKVVPKNNGAQFTHDTLYVQYIDGADSTVASTTTRFPENKTLFDISGGGYEIVSDENDGTGRACQFDVETGDFFVLGRFVNASRQSILLNPYGQTFTGAVGFKVVQEVVNQNDDPSLYDNTGGVSNTSAPGADRYRISLTLAKESDLTSDDTFVFLANIENSKIVEGVDESDAYNKINELLALRTDEESGDYIVNPFSIHFEEEVADDSAIDLVVSSGTAYVNGFRVNVPSPVKLEIPRPQQTDNINNDVVPVEYGNYFLADSARTDTSLNSFAIKNISTHSLDASLDVIGTCRIRSVEKASGISALPNQATHKVYVFDINLNDGANLSDARSVGTSSTDRISIAEDGTSGARLFDITNNDLLMPTRLPRLESISNILLKVQRRVVKTGITGTGPIDINDQLISADDEQFVDTANWIVNVSDADGGFLDHTVNAGVVTLGTSLAGTSDVEILYYVQTSASVATKTLLSNQTKVLDLVESDGVNYYKFDHVDIFDVDSVRNTSSTGIDMIDLFTLDDGQRDNYYQKGRLVLSAEDSAPSQVFVNYSRLKHNNDGDFYAASSYNGIGYGRIPTHQLANGQEVSLFNFLDFRSDKLDDSAVSDNKGSFENIKPLPKSGEVVTGDISYYLPRADKLILTQEGEVQLLMGQQSANPQYKRTPENAMDLYKILMKPNTSNPDDISFTAIEHPHYTMKDIAELEAKLDRLEEYTSLSILELNQRLEASLDSAGVARTEVGSVADDASDQTRTDTSNPDHAASIDPEGKVIRPKACEDNVRLIFDNTNSSGVIKKGDNVYLNYDSEEWAYQSLASQTVKVNTFGNTPNIGTIKLSPSSDEWKDTLQNATRVIEGQNKLDTNQALLWNSWQWNWAGRSAEEKERLQPEMDRAAQAISVGKSYNDPSDRYESSVSTSSGATGSPKFVSRPLSSTSIRSRVGNRLIDMALRPWIRSRIVYFHAKGLKPNTKFTPFFGGQKFDDWCREETFQKWSDRDDDFGNRYGYSLTEHPNGSSELVSDANGEIEGSFFIPSIRVQAESIRKYNSNLGARRTHQRFALRPRFHTGINEFMLLDIDNLDWQEAGSKAFAYYNAWGGLFSLWNRHWKWNRQENSPVPYSVIGAKALTQSAKELRDSLNKVTSGNINIVDPKTAGKYGTSQEALTTSELRNLDDNNTMSKVLSDYITVDKNKQAGSSINPVTPIENPLAQTFYVDNPYGLVLTKVQLFFRSRDTGNLPVSISIRPVEDGRPSATKIVPDSHVYVQRDDVATSAEGTTLSFIQSRPTTFEFEEPIYLQPWSRYAIVVQSQSTEYELYSAQTQQNVFGSTERTITTQPIPGELFLPQNGKNYVGSKDQDLMYRMIRAKFELGGGSLIMKNGALPRSELANNPIYTTANTKIIVVDHPNHGHRVGDTKVRLSGIKSNKGTSDKVNGIDLSSLNDTDITITSASLNRYGFTCSSATNANETGRAGGNEVRSRQNVIFTTANLQLENNVPRSTSIDVSAKFRTGSYISGNSARYTEDAQYQRITPGQNIDFDIPRAVYFEQRETDQFSGNRSTYVKVDFKTSNDYVSPIVDMQRASLILAAQCIDNPDVSPSPIENVPETNPSGGTTGSKHITAPVKLNTPAVGIDTRAMVNIPDSAEIDFYYRVCDADEDLWQQPWVKQEPRRTLPKRSDTIYEQTEFLPGGQNGTLKPFYQAQTKFVFKGGNKAPSMKEIKTRFLAD